MNYAGRYPEEAFAVEQPDVRDPGDGGLDLRAMVGLVWRAKWKMVAGALAGLILALVYTSSLDPTYTARATVLFSPGQRNIVNIEDVIAAPTQNELRNQIEVLRSTNLMTRVVDRLDLQRYPDFNPSLRVETGFLAKLQPWLSWRTYVPWETLHNLGVVAPPPPPREMTEAEIAEAERLTARNILAEVLKFTPVPDSRVITLSVTVGDPRLAELVANTVAQEYITAQLDAKLAATREATLWLSDRVEELKTELGRAENAVSAYEAEVAGRTGQSVAVLTQQLGTLNEGLAEAAAARSAAEIRYQRARAALDSTDAIATIVEFQNSDVIRTARSDERGLLSERTQLARLVPAGHERLGALDARIEAVRDEIRAEATRLVTTLENELRVTGEEVEEYRRTVRGLEVQIQEQEAAEIRLRQLQREAEASRLIYETFLGRLKETTQQEKLEEADAVILSPAERPGAADSTRRTQMMVLGLLLGTGAGFGLSLLLERLNNTFRSIDQVQEMTGLTVLGTVPYVGRNQTRGAVLEYALEKPSSALAEAIRSLRTSLLFSRLDSPPQVVMFTSTIPGEGKSTTSLLLALTSAQMGKSAIIVDCDLRRPTLNSFLKARTVENAGLRGVLDGSLTLDEAVFIDPASGLSVLTSRVEQGTVINAADVLSSDKFGDLIATLRQRYDLVILDAPPTLSVTDARIISQRADTALYCVRWDHTVRETVVEGLREFSLVKPRIAGLVVTMVNAEKAARYGYGGYGSYKGYYRGTYGDPYYTN